MSDLPDNLRLDRLCRQGDPHDTWRWREGNPDYVAEYGLMAEDIPRLLEIARQWAEPGPRPQNEMLYAPIHAWRALGQLRAREAVEPLLAMQNQLNADRDDWFLSEFHHVFGMIGPAAIPALAAYLADPGNREFARVSVAEGLREIGKRHPETRQQAVGLLTDQLAKNESNVYSLNGLLVACLLDLDAVESAEVIERAYAAGVVEEAICGDWDVVREELGVPGLSLLPDAPVPRTSGAPDWFGLRDSPKPQGEQSQEKSRRDPRKEKRRRELEKRAEAMRKQQTKSRKRNRKRR